MQGKLQLFQWNFKLNIFKMKKNIYLKLETRTIDSL
jgi:hypothetical protein